MTPQKFENVLRGMNMNDHQRISQPSPGQCPFHPEVVRAFDQLHAAAVARRDRVRTVRREPTPLERTATRLTRLAIAAATYPKPRVRAGKPQ